MKVAYAAILIWVSPLSHAADQWDEPLPPPEIMWWQNGGDITFDALENKAESGDARAMAQCAMRLITTRERPYDEPRVLKLLTDAADKNDALGHAGLAWCYSEGRGGVVDREKQFQHAEAAAKDGFHHGLYQLALCYLSGHGVGGDRAKGKELLEKAAEKGNPWALRWKIRMGYGSFGKRGSAEALRELVAKEFPPAQFDLGEDLFNSGDEKEGAELMKKSVIGGYTYGMSQYGKKLMEQGDHVAGFDWILESYERGNLDGLRGLRKFVQEGNQQEQKIYRDATALAYIYEKEHVRTDFDEYFPAQLAGFYLDGYGVEKNGAKAVKMVEDAWRLFEKRDRDHSCWISAISSRVYSEVDPPLEDKQKALWYSQYTQHADSNSVSRIAWFHAWEEGNQYDPVRGWAAHLTAKKRGMNSPNLDQAVEWLEDKLTKEQLAEAKLLSEDGFPGALKYQQEAARALGRKVPDQQLPK